MLLFENLYRGLLYESLLFENLQRGLLYESLLFELKYYTIATLRVITGSTLRAEALYSSCSASHLEKLYESLREALRVITL